MIDGGKADRKHARAALPDRPAGSARSGRASSRPRCFGSASARGTSSKAWSADAVVAQQNLQRELDSIAAIVAKIELLLRLWRRARIYGAIKWNRRALDDIGSRPRADAPTASAWRNWPRWRSTARPASAMGGADREAANGTADAGEGIDLSLIAQLLGDKQAGLAIQQEVLLSHRLFRSPCTTKQPRLRVLALAAATDMGSNTPIEFLLEESGIELMMLYVIPGPNCPSPLPDHDIAIVIASELRGLPRGACARSTPLRRAGRVRCSIRPRWSPASIATSCFRLLDGIDGLEIPATLVVTPRTPRGRGAIAGLSSQDIAAGSGFPVIIRPRGSHAGSGLARIDDAAALTRYLDEPRGRAVLHLALRRLFEPDGLCSANTASCSSTAGPTPATWRSPIAGTSGISTPAWRRARPSASRKRPSCAPSTSAFAARHHGALTAIAERVGLDYFTVDCAETGDGSLLIFEADNTAVVHNMDHAARLSLQAAADAQDLRRLCRDAGPPGRAKRAERAA